MGLVRSALSARGPRRSGLATPEKWVVDWVTGGLDTPAGVRVDQDTALHYSAFFGGVRVIAEDVATLPLIVYERLERGKRRAPEHPLYPVLHEQPNPYMSSVGLRETLQGHALTWGDACAYIVRDGDGQVAELWPLRPDRVRVDVRRDGARFRPWYRYRAENAEVVLAPEDVLHIPGLGFDGVRGYSVVAMARNSIGLGLATEQYGASFFGNGSRPGGVLQHPDRVSPEARERIKADWENLHRGLDRANRVAVLEEGVTWQQIGIPPEDAQFLETRKLQVTEMARWLRIPPHKIGDLERATFSNIESQQLDYFMTALRIWLVRWEQAILTQLLTARERRRYFAEHLQDALLQGDTKTRYEAYAIGRNWGWLSANDVRERENDNPVDGGDQYLVPLNMMPADQLGGQPGQPGEPPRGAPRGADRSAEARRRLMGAYAPRIADADSRLAQQERDEVTALARDHLGLSVEGFAAAVADFYGRTMRTRTTAAFTGVFGELAAAVAGDAAADVAAAAPDLTRWIAAYVASHVDHRVGSATGQIRSAATGADDPVRAVTELVEGWVTERPERTAAWESVQVTNAAAREAWRAAGVARLRWVTVGGNCPFCRAMDGAVVGIEAPFVPAGGQVTGLEEKLQVDRDTHHPPIHPGCNCEIVPG